jgi:uncharacterized membrane protein
MITVTLYTRKDCHLCEQAAADLAALQDAVPHKLVTIDIDSDPALQSTYALDVPVIEVGPYRLKAPFSRQELKTTLNAAVDRKSQLERLNDKAYQTSAQRGQTISGSDQFSFWLTRHYMAVFNVMLFLYVGLPFLAPVFKKIDWNGPAEVIYKVYSPLCHQWAFRSFFLFGQQLDYPHAAANVPGLISFEAATGITDQNDPARLQARLFEGNPVMGYKVAFCERDVAIWGALFLFGLVFALSGRRIPKLHWLIWIIVGIVPIGLDGFSQLFSQLPSAFIQSILPYRESTPLLRVITGVLFGGMTAWFMFPLIEEAMIDTRSMLTKKFAILKAQ